MIGWHHLRPELTLGELRTPLGMLSIMVEKNGVPAWIVDDTLRAAMEQGWSARVAVIRAGLSNEVLVDRFAGATREEAQQFCEEYARRLDRIAREEGEGSEG